MKKAFQLFDYIATLCKNGKNEQKKIEHVHLFIFQHYTGKSINNKISVCKCKCGQWSIRHFGDSKYILMDPIE